MNRRHNKFIKPMETLTERCLSIARPFAEQRVAQQLEAHSGNPIDLDSRVIFTSQSALSSCIEESIISDE